MHIKTLAGILVSLLLSSCSKPTKDLTSYDSATAWVQAEYEAEVMEPESTDIHRAEFYISSPEKWLIVYFKSNKSKGYLYKSFTAVKWSEWKSASSKGSWYHRNLKGNSKYYFTPQN